MNIWDDDYPSGGNYWSDYTGVDEYSGPYQNETGSDGIGDTPYVIDENNQDNYPFMSKNGWMIITATIDVAPDTLNLKSQGKWITCYIELPEGYDVAYIDVSTISVNGVISAEPHPTDFGDYDYDSVPDLMVKFDRAAVIEHIRHDLGITDGEVTLAVKGEVAGTHFEGTDTIRVISKGKGN